MSDLELTQLLEPNTTTLRGGVYVASGLGDHTIWDDNAIENPTNAVISATNEAEAEQKSQAQITEIKQHLKPGDILLDLGAGYGRIAQYLLPQMVLGGYIAVDSSQKMLSLFRDRYVRRDEEMRTPALALNADIHTLPLQAASVDVVLVAAVFLHNHKDVVAKSMAEVKRVLKPGGTLLVYSSFPRAATGMGIQGQLYQAYLNLAGKPYKNGPVRYYSKREVQKMLNGFEAVTIKPFGFAVVPKGIIFLPKFLDRIYRLWFANPVNNLLATLIPKSLKPYFATHYDVVAKR